MRIHRAEDGGRTSEFGIRTSEVEVRKANLTNPASAFWVQDSGFGVLNSRAFTLIECLVYISVFAIIATFATQVFFQGRDTSHALLRSADDISRAVHAGEHWREEIRTATAAPRIGEENGRAVIAISHGTNTTFYTHFNNTVWRLPPGSPAWTPALARVKSSRMEPDARTHVTAWRWEVELQLKDEQKKTKPLFTFLAVAPRERKP